MPDFSRVKLLIVDLDNTMCDTFHTLSKDQWKAAAKALEQAGAKKHAAIVRRNLGKHSFKLTIQDFPKKEQSIALKSYDSVGVNKLRLYDDAHAILDLGIPKVLVTRGERGLQVRKIHHLKIGKYFRKVYFVPTLGRKEEAFRKILKEFKRTPSECMVIGDRIEEEIKDANTLRMPSALVDRPDWPTHKVAKPDITARSLWKIAERLK